MGKSKKVKMDDSKLMFGDKFKKSKPNKSKKK